MSSRARWSSGDHALLRFRYGGHVKSNGRITYALPVIVVEDSPDLVALYLAAGTPIKRRLMPDGSPMPREIPYRVPDGWEER